MFQQIDFLDSALSWSPFGATLIGAFIEVVATPSTLQVDVQLLRVCQVVARTLTCTSGGGKMNTPVIVNSSGAIVADRQGVGQASSDEILPTLSLILSESRNQI